MNGIRGFFHEQRRRKVFRSVALYVVAAWVVLQVADLAFPGLGIAEEAIRYVWIGVFAGFPLALLFAWRYQVTAHGIVRTAPLDAGEAATLPLGKPDYLLLGAMLLVAGGVAYQLVTEIRQVPTRSGLFTREIPLNSIAVLPLQNVTGDPEQEYFVTGMHDALITDLSKISALRVISRGSANVYRNVVQPVRQTGLELGVAHIIEGSVFRSGDRVRINVQLIDSVTDQNLWSESYERDIRDVMVLQGELAREVAQQVQVQVTPDEEIRLTRAGEVDPETYEAYLKGMFHLKQYTREGIGRGLEYLQEAVERDPENAAAHAGLALGYNTIGHGIGRDAFPKAMAAARRALELDEYSGEAWAALAEAQVYYEWDWATSEESYGRALQLSSNLDHARAHHAFLLVLLGRWEDAFAEAEKARQLSPLDPTWAAFAAWLYMLDERYDEAYAAVYESLELDPEMPLGRYTLVHILTSQGRLEEAIEVAENIPRDHPVAKWALGPTYAMAGRYDEARQIAAELAEDPGPKDKLSLAFTYAGLGEYDEAMRWLESCYETRVDWLPWIASPNAYGGVLEPLRQDPRFQTLIDRLDLSLADSLASEVGSRTE
jgi:TolB-like protein/Flp pilus assembly protein TadD